MQKKEVVEIKKQFGKLRTHKVMCLLRISRERTVDSHKGCLFVPAGRGYLQVF